jgi:glucokinase
LAAVDVVCRRVAQAFGTMVNLLNLQRCLVGGGISAGGDLLCDRILANMSDFTWRFLLERTEVRIAERGNDAGLLGAAALAWARFG